jgi:hypothetical protein
MRKALLLLLLIAGSANAGEIRGKVHFNPAASGEVNISYVGLTSEGKRISDMAGLTVGPGESWVWCTTNDPRRTGVKWSPEKGLTFQCLQLPVGKYLVAVKNGNFLDRKIVEIAKHDELVDVMLVVDHEQSGKLHVNISKGKGDYEVAIAPLGNDGQPLIIGVAPDKLYHMRVVTKIKQSKTAKLEGIKPGQYHLMLRSVEQIDSGSSGAATMLTPVGATSVTVQLGKEATVTLP